MQMTNSEVSEKENGLVGNYGDFSTSAVAKLASKTSPKTLHIFLAFLFPAALSYTHPPQDSARVQEERMKRDTNCILIGLFRLWGARLKFRFVGK